MPFNTTHANKVLDYIFGQDGLNVKSRVYIGLCTNDPEADDGAFTELSGNGYARVLIEQYGESFPNLISSASNRSISNAYQINWTKATADWPEANGFGLFDAATGGTPYFYGKLANPVACPSGAVALFDPEGLALSFPASDSTGSGGSTGGTAIFVNQALGEFSDQNGLYGFSITPTPFTLTVGNTYKVVWDGAEHECVCADSNGAYIGNMGALTGGDDTGEPFMIGAGEVDGDSVALFYVTDGSTATTHSVAIYEL